MRSFGRPWSELRRFQRLAPQQRSIVFYAEDAASWTHLGPLVENLAQRRNLEVCYLTSAPNDPILRNDSPRIRSFYIGEGVVRTIVFLCMRADVVVMTMPELERFHLKRSKLASVHYVYVFHSLVSTHMVYRPGAFDHYDAILCAGPHHVAEIRAWEQRHKLKSKNLCPHGYGRLDTLIRNRRNPQTSMSAPTEPRRVLLAPSWGPSGLLETSAVEVVKALLTGGSHVTVRPHPMTAKKRPDVIGALERQFGSCPRFVLETDVASTESLCQADVMVSDWSGAALEYALAFERPVVFVDVPRKINNPAYQQIPLTPIEVGLRNELGEIVPLADVHELSAAVDRLRGQRNSWVERIRSVRERIVFNLGASADAGAVYIAKQMRQHHVLGDGEPVETCGA